MKIFNIEIKKNNHMRVINILNKSIEFRILVCN